MKTLGEYSDFYLLVDVLILADVIETFRDTCLEHYKLDPIYFCTAPSLFWKSMLKMTDVSLELLTDYSMVQYFEEGTRGGVSSILGKRYINVEHKNYLINKNIDFNAENQEYIFYIDANNLYGHAMMQKLPIGEFSWIDVEQEVQDLERRIKNNEITGEEEYGYWLRIDLIIPKTPHFENYPLAPESKTIKYDQLSDYQKNLLGENKKYKSKKLVLDFMDKKDYFIHIKHLILCYQLGAVFKIKDAIRFKQEAWLKPYIEFNTNQRSVAKNDFEKDFFKLANNSVFGKTMENVRGYVNIKLCNTAEQIRKQLKKPNFKSYTIFNKDLVAMHMDKLEVFFNKPIYVGATILELAKVHMYDFYYNKLKPMFKEVKALYTDTDCFVLHIKDDNIIQKLKQNENYFDFSDYPKDHILYSTKNKKVVGKFKDELNGMQMTEFGSLRAKMYAFLKYDDDNCHMRAKGIPTSSIKKETTFGDFKECLFKNKGKQYAFHTFVSKKHQIYTEYIHKKGLDPFDDKRYYLDNINSEPYLI